MNQNSDAKNKYKDIEEFFATPPDSEEKAWHVIHMFYHHILTIMEEKKIKQVDIAKRLNKSKSAVSKMLNNSPNISILKMAELADAVGCEIEISVRPVDTEKKSEIIEKKRSTTKLKKAG